MENKDYYEILGLTIDDRKLNDEDFNKKLKSKYRSLSKKYHPDLNPNNKEAEELFKNINLANEVLSDKDKRANYDRFGTAKPSMGGHYEDFINMFHRRQSRNRGVDLKLNIKCSLEEIYHGTHKKIKYNRLSTCNKCSGKGGTGEKKCVTCGGTGQIHEVFQTPMGYIENITPCHVCNMTGVILDSNCLVCNGNGTNQIEETIEFDIPSGAPDGATMIIDEKGNSVKNGRAGRLMLILTEQSHQSFIRSGNDIKYNLKLTYPQLVLGDKVDVPIIEGGKIRITVNPYSNIGDNLRIRNKGFKIMNTQERGDMIIILSIEIPRNISNEEKKIIEKLKEIQK